MRCSKCGAENPDRAKFCVECASPFTRRCPSCNADNPSTAKFCLECAKPLNSASGRSQSIAEPATSPIQVTGTADAQLDGERKTVTMLFADIKGSMELIEDLDPEEARAIVDPALKLMIEAVQRYGGYVAQSTGDGIFALFGAPVAHEDHPQRALYAAVRMQEELKRYSDRVRAEGRLPIQARVGVNTGEVVVRSITTGEGRTEYAPVGHSTGIAARMQALAPVGSIAATDQVRKLCEGYFVFKSLGPTRVKGVTEQVHVYEVTGLGPLRTPLQRAARRGLTKFVGRQPEMDAMAHAAELAKAGRGQIVAAVAEPGVGKSRLFHEFRARHQSEWSVIEAPSFSHSMASIYLPVIGLLNTYFGIDTTDDTRKRREKVNGKILTLDRALEDTLPFLYSLLELSEGDDSLAQMDSQARRRRTLDAIKRIVLREALNQPLIVIFEDLHWIDAETQALLKLLIDSIGSAQVLMLLNYRPEYRHDWGTQASYTQLRLQPLAGESAAEMLTALIGEAAEVQALRRLITESTGGNPLFIEEIILELFEDGTLTRNGVVNVTRPLSQLRIPSSVKAILASRIDRLQPDEKQLIQTLAIIGNEFEMRLVTAVTVQPESAIVPMMAELEVREFIFEQLTADEIQYRFKHALTHDVAASLMLTDKRKALHERTAQAIESMFADRIDAHVNELAYHYGQSANFESAIKYLTLAGQQAIRRYAPIEAVSKLRGALELLGKLPESAERDRQELELRFAIAGPLEDTKGFTVPEVEQTWRRAYELSRRIGDPLQILRAQAGNANVVTMSGNTRRASPLWRGIIPEAESLHDPVITAVARDRLGMVDFYLGNFDSALSALKDVVQQYEQRKALNLASPREAAVALHSVSYEAWTLWYMGLPEQALQKIDQTLALAQTLSSAEIISPMYMAMALNHAARVSMHRRDVDRARELAEASIAIAAERGLIWWLANSTMMRGLALALAGDTAEGIRLVEKGLAEIPDLGAKEEFSGWLAEAYGTAGRFQDGLNLLAKVIKDDVKSTANVTWLHRLKGELLLLRDPANAADAERCFRTAIQADAGFGAKGPQLRATTSLARLLRDTGRRDEARTMLAEIYNWFTEGFDTADLKDAKSLLEDLSK
jgi:class 3 adenylate cyclase/tetratricopeptide (TPR) repeat protein/ribosomal protein L40E